jgi:hypothetical protein
MGYDVAIIASTISERQPLLDRSVQTWCDDAEASGLSVAIRIYGDGCDPMSDAVGRVAQRCDVQTHATQHSSGSHVTGYNHFHVDTDTRVYIFTHPEIIFPRGTINAAVEHAAPDAFVTFKVFWLPSGLTNGLEECDLATLESHPDLYPLDPREHGEFYWNSDIRSIKRWESSTTYAVDAPTAGRLFPMPAFSEWGPDDPYLLSLRSRLSIATDTIMDPVLFHQWHPHGPIDEERIVQLAEVPQ